MTHRIIGITGIVIALFNIVNVANSTWYFLGMAHFTVPAWLAFNACAPSVALYLAGYFSGRKRLMAAALPFMLFFGTGGLFVFGWSGTSLYAQAGHIAMTLASIWIIAKISAEKSVRVSAIGFAAGLAVFLLVLPLQQHYVKSHPECMKALGDGTFEKFMNKG